MGKNELISESICGILDQNQNMFGEWLASMENQLTAGNTILLLGRTLMGQPAPAAITCLWPGMALEGGAQAPTQTFQN